MLPPIYSEIDQAISLSFLILGSCHSLRSNSKFKICPMSRGHAARTKFKIKNHQNKWSVNRLAVMLLSSIKMDFVLSFTRCRIQPRTMRCRSRCLCDQNHIAITIQHPPLCFYNLIRWIFDIFPFL